MTKEEEINKIKENISAAPGNALPQNELGNIYYGQSNFEAAKKC